MKKIIGWGLFSTLLFGNGVLFSQTSKNEDVNTLNSLIQQTAQETGESSFAQEFFNMLVMLGLLIAVLIVGMWLIKKLQMTKILTGNTSNMIKVIEQRALSPKTNIYILHINDQALVIADSHNGASLLTTFPMEPEPRVENTRKTFNV